MTLATAIWSGIARVEPLLQRLPWLLPTLSFALGWLSFFLFQRGENLARGIAVIALLGWPWLLAENVLGRWLVLRSSGRLSIGAVRFITQQIQQEILFFSLPFLLGASLLIPGHVLFVALALAVALAVSVDPVYFRRIAPHRGLSSALHAYCTLIASLVVLPIVLHLPLDLALPLSLMITALTLLASLPRMLLAVGQWRMRLFGCLALVLAIALLWVLRGWIPPAGLWVRDARMTDSIEEMQPGPARDTFSTSELHEPGVAAFVAVRAPTGLSQWVTFEWYHEGQLMDRIPAKISGGREAGFRTWSRKQNFPDDARGRWRVDLRTPDGQVVAQMRFSVKEGQLAPSEAEGEAKTVDLGAPDRTYLDEVPDDEPAASQTATPAPGPTDQQLPAEDPLTGADRPGQDDVPAAPASETDAPAPGSADQQPLADEPLKAPDRSDPDDVQDADPAASETDAPIPESEGH